MSLENRLETTAAAIGAAFAGRSLPKKDPVFASGSPELDSDHLLALARQHGWRDLPWTSLCANSIALALATPAGFAYFLPACMTASLKHYAQCGSLTSMILTCLTPDDEGDSETMAELERDFESLEPGFLGEGSSSGIFAESEGMREEFEERIAPLTGEEKAAVRVYLKYLDEVHGDDFPAFGPREALERFWADAERGDGQRP
ncbi:MAG: hypothetical protein QOJ27_650 [Sphingomonadales bacterium]|nr:hypothetical protein [Sphingomonadales bacterium]